MIVSLKKHDPPLHPFDLFSLEQVTPLELILRKEREESADAEWLRPSFCWFLLPGNRRLFKVLCVHVNVILLMFLAMADGFVLYMNKIYWSGKIYSILIGAAGYHSCCQRLIKRLYEDRHGRYQSSQNHEFPRSRLHMAAI